MKNLEESMKRFFTYVEASPDYPEPLDVGDDDNDLGSDEDDEGSEQPESDDESDESDEPKQDSEQPKSKAQANDSVPEVAKLRGRRASAHQWLDKDDVALLTKLHVEQDPKAKAEASIAFYKHLITKHGASNDPDKVDYINKLSKKLKSKDPETQRGFLTDIKNLANQAANPPKAKPPKANIEYDSGFGPEEHDAVRNYHKAKESGDHDVTATAWKKAFDLIGNKIGQSKNPEVKNWLNYALSGGARYKNAPTSTPESVAALQAVQAHDEKHPFTKILHTMYDRETGNVNGGALFAAANAAKRHGAGEQVEQGNKKTKSYNATAPGMDADGSALIKDGDQANRVAQSDKEDEKEIFAVNRAFPDEKENIKKLKKSINTYIHGDRDEKGRIIDPKKQTQHSLSIKRVKSDEEGKQKGAGEGRNVLADPREAHAAIAHRVFTHDPVTGKLIKRDPDEKYDPVDGIRIINAFRGRDDAEKTGNPDILKAAIKKYTPQMSWKQKGYGSATPHKSGYASQHSIARGMGGLVNKRTKTRDPVSRADINKNIQDLYVSDLKKKGIIERPKDMDFDEKPKELVVPEVPRLAVRKPMRSTGQTDAEKMAVADKKLAALPPQDVYHRGIKLDMHPDDHDEVKLAIDRVKKGQPDKNDLAGIIAFKREQGVLTKHGLNPHAVGNTPDPEDAPKPKMESFGARVLKGFNMSLLNG